MDHAQQVTLSEFVLTHEGKWSTALKGDRALAGFRDLLLSGHVTSYETWTQPFPARTNVRLTVTGAEAFLAQTDHPAHWIVDLSSDGDGAIFRKFTVLAEAEAYIERVGAEIGRALDNCEIPRHAIGEATLYLWWQGLDVDDAFMLRVTPLGV